MHAARLPPCVETEVTGVAPRCPSAWRGISQRYVADKSAALAIIFIFIDVAPRRGARVIIYWWTWFEGQIISLYVLDERK
jgi:hypothetical protein